MKIGLRKWNFFTVKEFFRMNFDFKNECKNECKDKKEKSWSWSRNKVSHKIDFKPVWPRNGHADSVGVKNGQNEYLIRDENNLLFFKEKSEGIRNGRKV